MSRRQETSAGGAGAQAVGSNSGNTTWVNKDFAIEREGGEEREGPPPDGIYDFLVNRYDSAWLARPRPPRFRPVVVEVTPGVFRVFYFDGAALLVKTVSLRSRKGRPVGVFSLEELFQTLFAHRVEYCGPLLYKSRRGDKVFVEIGGRVRAAAATVDELYDYLQHVEMAISRCEDPDAVSGEVAGRIPPKQVLQDIVSSLPWRVEWDEIIDVENGVDHGGRIRRGENVEVDARRWAEMQKVLKKAFGANAVQALANAALFAPSVYSYIFNEQKLNPAVRDIIYNWGETGLGKSTLMNVLVQTICSTAKCAADLLLKIDSGVDTPAQLRVLLDYNKLPLVLDDQNEVKLRSSIDILLAAATGNLAKIHAPRYGHGEPVRFLSQRAIFVASNAAPQRLLALVPNPSSADALARRLLSIRWEPEPIDPQAAKWLTKEYDPPPLFPFAAEVYKACRGELERADNLVDMAKKFWACASKRFNLDFSDFIAALEAVERMQQEEKPSSTMSEFERFWAVVRRYLDPRNELTDLEVLTRLLNNQMYVYYVTYRDWEQVREKWEKTCLYSTGLPVGGADDRPAELISALCRCYFGVDNIELLPPYARQLILTVESLITRGQWPVLRGRTDIVGVPRRVLGVEKHERKVGGAKIYTYDVFDQIIKNVIGESQEEVDHVDTGKEQSEISTSPRISTGSDTVEQNSPAESSQQSLNTPTRRDAEETQNSIPHTPVETRGDVEMPPSSLQTPQSGENNVKGVDKGETPHVEKSSGLDEERYRECIRSKYAEYAAKGLPREKAIREAMRECL